ncbi:CPBP family intramembrane glutamic endopeptidase [Neobacillus sp. SAB-20_R2A]|uniref:CPBP family intramembrane glutamic endopeptidase n=1 Tax=Neobacillus sp. SAB-20_R2A TaxID=3120519 RepID=UPI003C6E2AF0
MKKNYIRSLSIVLINVLTLFALMVFWGKRMDPLNIVQWGTLTVIGAVLQTVSILLFYKYVDKKSFSTLRLKLNRKDVLFSILSVLLTAVMVLIYLFQAAKVDQFSVEWNLAVFSNVTFYLLLLLAAFAWFQAALTEEVLFRWYLVTNLDHLSTIKLYLITSLFFMLSHVFKGFDPIYILFLLTTSCSLLYVYLRSGRKLMPVTFAHMAQNLTINHLIGPSDIAILQFTTEPSIIHLIALFILYNALIIGLSTMIYRK